MRGMTIFEVTVDKGDLLEIIQHNRDKHKSIFDKAIEKYRERLIAYLNTSINEVKDGKIIDHYIRLPVPEEHTADYDRVIAMLSRHLPPTITIAEETYRNYVDDEWDWSKAFASNTASYANG
jgi:hypothetical protein